MSKLNLFLIISFLILAFLNLFFFPRPNFDLEMLLTLRLPHFIIVVGVGGALALSGASLQAVLSNPLCDPYILGIASVSAFSVVIAKSFFSNSIYLSLLLAIFFTLIFVFLYLKLLLKHSYSISLILLIGVMVGFFFSSLTTIFLILKEPSQWISQVSFLLGSLPYFNLSQSLIYFLILIFLSSLFLFFHKDYDLLSLGETFAASSGCNVKLVQAFTLILVSLISCIVVLLSGIIGFIGFMTPHLLRLFNINTHKKLLLLSFILGTNLLLFSDILSKTISYPSELPIGVIASLCGAPLFFISLLFYDTDKKFKF
jgi:iron complex transport system permease protein